MKLEFSRHIFENTQIQTFMKIREVGDEVFHDDGWTDGRREGRKEGQTDRQTDRHDEANSRSSQFREKHPKFLTYKNLLNNY